MNSIVFKVYFLWVFKVYFVNEMLKVFCVCVCLFFIGLLLFSGHLPPDNVTFLQNSSLCVNNLYYQLTKTFSDTSILDHRNFHLIAVNLYHKIQDFHLSVCVCIYIYIYIYINYTYIILSYVQ